MNKSVFIPSAFHGEGKFTPNELGMFLYYSLCFSENDNMIAFDYPTIGCQLFDRMPTVTEIKNIKEATQSLYEKGYITEIKKYSKSKIGVRFEYTKYEDEAHYLKLENKDFFRIMRAGSDVKGLNNFDVLDVYLTILGSFDGSKSLDPKYRFKICKIPRAVLLTKAYVAEYTFKKAANVLLESGILTSLTLVERMRGINFDCYARAEDAKVLHQYINETMDKELYFVGNKEACNSKRRMTSIYNWVLKGSNYPFYVLEMVRKFILEYAEENPDQDRYDLLEFDSYMEQAATDILIELYDVPKQTAKKFSEEIPADYDEIGRASCRERV